MTEKQKYAIDTIIAKLPDEYQSMYREIAEYTMSLGYIPSIKGASEQYVTFSKSYPKSKMNRTILKIVADCKCPPPHIEMKFFANTLPYSLFFKQAIEDRISHGWEDLCSKCGRCDSTHVYYTTYPNGKKRISCGYTSLVFMPPVYVENVSEIKDALKKQDDFYIKWFSL